MAARGSLVFLLMLGACVPMARRADLSRLQARASFDLGCPYEQVQLYHFDERAKGVSGCGRRLTYVEHCDRVRGDCTWMLDTPTFEQQLWPGQVATPSPPVTAPVPAPPPAPAAAKALPCFDRMCEEPVSRPAPAPQPSDPLIDRGF